MQVCDLDAAEPGSKASHQMGGEHKEASGLSSFGTQDWTVNVPCCSQNHANSEVRNFRDQGIHAVPSTEFCFQSTHAADQKQLIGLRACAKDVCE